MTDNDRDLELDSEVASLPGETEPPEHLRHDVLRALRERELLAAAGRARPRPHFGWRGVAAAAVLALAAGMGIGARLWQPAAPESATAAPIESLGPVYALLLHEGPDFELPDGGELREYHDYNTWIAAARAQGRFVDGLDLEPDGWTVGATVATRETGPVTGPLGPLASIFLVLAPSEQEALAMAETLPHVRYGGRVEVRRLARTDVAPGAGGR